MTSSICSGIATSTEGTLTDTRDSTEYYVGKMLDGKCWMLQNLALGNSSGSTTLTSADSNITANSWMLPTSYTAATSGNTIDTTIQSWNFGKWVLATPRLATSCGTSGVTTITQCTKVGFVDVSDTTKFQPTYTASTGTWDGANASSNTLVTVNCTSWSGSGTSKTCTAGAYDPHYLVGNRYTWNAATAGTGVEITSGQASGSICPKGWKLPTGSTGGELVGLLSKYGVSSKPVGSTYNIAGTPLRFARGGNVNPGDSLRYAGSRGYYWSSTPTSNSSNAYYLSVDDSSVNPSASTNRYSGFSVRCVSE